MHFFCLLVLLFGVSNAAQPSPVYRAAPTVLRDAPKPTGTPATAEPTLAPQVAQERESPAFSTSQEKVGNGAIGGQPPSLQTATKGTGSASGEQLYSVYYYPSAQPQSTFNLQQPGSPGVQQPQSAYPQTYQTREPGAGVPGGNGSVSNGSGYLSSISWTDVFVGGTSLFLMAAGAAMLYPGLVGLRARAMRELSELKGEDAERVARSVWKAIRRYSELNNRE